MSLQARPIQVFYVLGYATVSLWLYIALSCALFMLRTSFVFLTSFLSVKLL